MKNKKYIVNINVPFDLYEILEILREAAYDNPKEFGKFMVELGHYGDWTLEVEYLKHLRKDCLDDPDCKGLTDALQKTLNEIYKMQE